MKIIIAPNAFKDSLTAVEVADSMEVGIRRMLPDAEIIKLPIADGGDGTLELIIHASGGEMIAHEVIGPLGDTLKARFGVLPDGKKAIIEMAEASGLRLVPMAERDPMNTTTYGTGQLIKAALDHGCMEIIIGVGGSATVDGGIGMAQALGATLVDRKGDPVVYGGVGLEAVDRIDRSALDPRIKDVKITVACDVDNPLVGECGAAHIFGPQKGATPDIVKRLEAAMMRYGEAVERDLGVHVLDRPSAGAAGGLAAGLIAFLNADVQMGADVILDLMDMDTHLTGADLLITGEGRIDAQTVYGKGPISVVRRAKAQGAATIAIVGGLAEDASIVYDHGIDALMSIMPRPMPLEDALSSGADLISGAAERAMRLVLIGKRMQVK